MHELSIAQDIISIVTETLKTHPNNKVKIVRLNIGETIAVVPELLHHAYDAMIFDTPLQQSSLEIDIIPVTAVCSTCNHSFGLSEFEFACPVCFSNDIRIKSGNDFYVKEIEVESCP